MNAKNFDKQDQQVIDVVNEHASPEATQVAAQIAKEYLDGAYETAFSAEPRKERFWKMAAVVLLCALAAAALVAVMVWPKLLIWLVNAGLLICAAIMAVAVDRWWRG